MKKLLLTSSLLFSPLAFAGMEEVTSVSIPLGIGQKVTYAVVKYSETLDADQIKKSDFAVKDRNIVEVYLATDNDIHSHSTKGQYVVIKMDPQDPTASLLTDVKGQTPQPTSYTLEVSQVNPLTDVKSIAPETKVAQQSVNLVADDFTQLSFTDKDGTTINYNLYVPKDYKPQTEYPLVMFIHDAGVTSDYIKATLYQGNGATAWATPESQARHQAFVLAPQFADKIVTDKYEIPTKNINALIALINSLSEKYSIDMDRIYATGQSGGGMLEYALNITHPDFLAASYHVASQWDATQVAPMAHNKMFVFISKDDPKAYPTWQQMIPVLEKEGADIQTLEVKGNDSLNNLNSDVEKLLEKGGNIHLMYVASGTLPSQIAGTKSGPAAAHMGTWEISYRDSLNF
ncbi:hypothetical protein CKF54_06625, partial [Psittacicella hinzii]